MAPPRFKFKIVRTFQDPLKHQLSEAVMNEFRGERILNSKEEFSRCTVSRRRVDMEGWQEKQKEKEESKEPKLPRKSAETSQQEAEEIMMREAEESLVEKEQSN